MLPILHESYWRDEAFAVLLSQKPLSEIFSLTIIDTHPPLFYIILHYWIKLFGDTQQITRSITLLFHVMLVIISFFLLKHLLRNWKPTLVGSLAIFLNPFLLTYAFEVKGYSLFAFLIVTSTYFYIKNRKVLFAFFISLAVLTHNFGAFFLTAFAVHWLYFNKRKIKENYLEGVKFFIIPGIVQLSWLFVLWDEWGKVAEDFWIDPVTSSVFVDTFRSYSQGIVDYASKGMLYNVTLLLVFLALSYWMVSFLREGHRNKSNNMSVLIFVCAVPFLSIYLISAFWVSVFHARYLIPILPLIIIFIVISLYRLSKLKKTLSYMITALAASYILYAFQSAEEILRISTKPAINYGVEQVLQKYQEGDVIVSESKLNFLETKYYVRASEENIPVYSYTPSGVIEFYIGSVLYEEEEVITDYPEGKRVWVIETDGGHYLLSE